MYLVKLIILLFVCLAEAYQVFSNHNSVKKSEEIANLVKDVIENERMASILWMKNCWSKPDDLKFVKSISVPVQIVKASTMTINLPADANNFANKQWFIVDMDCQNSSNFLSNVDEKYFAHPYRWILLSSTADSIKNLTFLPGKYTSKQYYTFSFRETKFYHFSDSNIILANQDRESRKYALKQGGWWNYFVILISLPKYFY